MTKDELKKLNRAELLELLLDQAKAIEKLEQEKEEAKADFEQQMAEMKAKLESRELNIRESGTLAEAALKINEMFARADAAAKQYMDNSIAQADKILWEATQEVEQKKKEADDYWDMLSERMEHFYQDHAWLRELLDANLNAAQTRRSVSREEG